MLSNLRTVGRGRIFFVKNLLLSVIYKFRFINSDVKQILLLIGP